MSGLAKLLAGHTPPGVYHWTTATSLGDVQHTVERAGWRFVCLDTWAVEEKSAFLDVCEEAFAFPDWVGHNFDALADALSDVKPSDGGGVVVLWEGWAPMARAERRVFDVAVGIFSDRVDQERAGPFAVLLRGPGPDDTQLPELDPHHF
ncbi:MAG: barstar family protein [Nocardioidaceae bacterium]